APNPASNSRGGPSPPQSTKCSRTPSALQKLSVPTPLGWQRSTASSRAAEGANAKVTAAAAAIQPRRPITSVGPGHRHPDGPRARHVVEDLVGQGRREVGGRNAGPFVGEIVDEEGELGALPGRSDARVDQVVVAD